eukprot:GFUD01040714.1.p1 GENE.GFUD01040714.1~~GFUD01040714.1.p1  ORF type:complete len:911 (-),score=265.15 GFUD01040714.1:184-2916(-)
MSDNPPPSIPTGRARGRARARARTQEELDAVRMPGQLPFMSQGRGRGVTPEGRGRGVTPERVIDPEVPTGRAYHRGGSATTAQPGSSGAGSAESAASEKMAGLAIGSSNSNGNGGNGNGNGSAPSVGRGATRGRRDRATEYLPRTRPDNLVSKKGSGGEEITITANFFALVAKPNWRLMLYRVDMVPEIDNTKVRKGLLYVHKDRLGSVIFDGTVLYTDSTLTPDQKPLVLNSKRESDGQVVVITIRLVEEIQPSDYHYTVFFNIVLRRCMEGMKMQLVGRNYYDPSAKVALKQFKLELWPGYETSIRQHENSVLLCCEVSHKILRTDTVLEQMQEVFKTNKANFRSGCEKILLGCIVLTRYNNKTYRIDDISWEKHPTDSFESSKGTPMTFIEYYEGKYNRTIRDGQQPLLVSMPTLREKRSGVNGPVLLIPELCFMTGLSDEQRANFNLMKAMGDYTRQDPAKRTQTLAGFSKRIKDTPEIQEELKNWNLRFAEELVKFRARILAPEAILGAGSAKFTYSHDNADWGGAFRNWKQWSVVNCSKWAVVYAPRDATATQEFINMMLKVGPSLGMIIGKPKVFELLDNRPVTYIQTLDRVIDMKPAIVMVVIPNNKGDHYAVVKKKCCLEKPIPSQCMTATVLGKPKGLMSVATKVALQMNCKLGGEPWAVKIPLKNTMVIGYDTYHDSLHKDKSVGAVVASINATFTKFISMADFHSNQSEMTDKMCPAIAKALRKYNSVNGCLPERVIMYRDGVGDGQIPYVVEHEVAAITKCFNEAGMDEVKFTYIIVSKRINTRLFRNNGKPTNPPSGTVVDDVITLPERYDFFLVSQSVRQGTVNPTSYNVVKDTSGLRPDHIQSLTYKLTHLYYNWPGTVRVPAVCQYAHKLALLVGDSLHKMPAEGLGDLLYYL